MWEGGGLGFPDVGSLGLGQFLVPGGLLLLGVTAGELCQHCPPTGGM